jgi:hypothetical protein
VAKPLNNQTLADALIKLVRDQHLEQIPDSMLDGQPLRHFPSLDLAVVAFPRNAPPVWANVLFSRDFPEGHIAETGDEAGPVRNVRYLKDQLNAHLESFVWFPDCDWTKLQWGELYGEAVRSFVVPYPASLLKVMVLVGVARLVDAGRFTWDQHWTYLEETKSIAAWADSMIVASNNDATSALVSVLHAGGLIVSTEAGEKNLLHALFESYGLHTLKLANTRADGGWRSANGAGVGSHHMTAWDCVRLLWLLADEDARAPWLPENFPPILSPDSRRRFWSLLGDQGLHEILSTTALVGIPGWQAGIPAHLPQRWIKNDGSVQVEHIAFPADVREQNALADASFAHKTGNTDNYASDGGLVEGDGGVDGNGRRYLIAMYSSIGRRYRPDVRCATDWRIPALGAAIDRWLAEHLE